jgi:hypothetical protein
MLFEHRAFWLPKDVQNPSGYEDAFDVDGVKGVAAICDGVSSTLFSGRWAGILAKAVVADPPNVNDPERLEAWLKGTREAWSRSIDENALAWHQKPKLLDGAGTTLLWVRVTTLPGPDRVARPYQLYCYSIGDCCLFHIRGGQILQNFPVQESSRFEENPQVIRSVYKRGEVVAFEAMETQCNPGDLLMLCTDAIAAWTMRQLETGASLDWEAFWHTSDEQWQQWLMALRQDNQIRYDDSTLVVLRIGGSSAAPSRRPAEKQESILDATERGLRGALKSLKGSLRKGLRDLSDSKWLDESKRR